LQREAGDDVYGEVPRSELLPELPIDTLLACMAEPDQTSAVRDCGSTLCPLVARAQCAMAASTIRRRGGRSPSSPMRCARCSTPQPRRA
jgi:hypothetical protein